MRATISWCLCLLGLVLACAEAPTRPGRLELATEHVDLGAVELGGRAAVRPVALTNVGTEPVTLHRVVLDASSDELALVAPAPGKLAGGEVVTLRFTYIPRALSTLSATVTITGDRVLTLHVRGRGATLEYSVEQGDSTCAGAAGSLALGTSDGVHPAEQAVRIHSTGTGPIRVQATLEGAPTGLTLDPAPFEAWIEPGTSAAVTVRYDPAIPAPAAATLVLKTSSALFPGARIALCADARFAAMCVRPARLDLGDVAAGARGVGHFEVSSCGNEPLALGEASLATDAAHPASPGFVVTSSAPLVLPPGVATRVRVALTGPASGSSSAFVRLVADAPKSPEVFAPVTANTGRPCELVATPARIALRTQVFPEQEVRVSNVGSAPCTVTSLALSPAHAELSLTRPPQLPVVVPPHGELVFGVAYAGSPSSLTSDLKIASTHAADLTVPVVADAERPSGCFLAAQPTVDFGLQRQGATTMAHVQVVNHGLRACHVNSVRLDPSSDARFDVSGAGLPTHLQPSSSAFIPVTFQATGRGAARGRVLIQTDDEDHPELTSTLFAGHLRCDEACACTDEETLTLWRFETGVPSSLIETSGLDAFYRSCDEDRCAPGLVAVEVSRNTFECVTAPAACAPGTGLSYDERADHPALSCVPCEFTVQYGGLFDYLRLCAPRPDVSCTGDVPTFDVDARAWQCAPACNNGTYDRVYIDGDLVCVPC